MPLLCAKNVATILTIMLRQHDQLEQASPIAPLRLGHVTIHNRLIVGTGKYPNYEVMQEALEASGTEVVTVAVRRERLIDQQGR